MHMRSDKASIHIPCSEKCYNALSRAVYFDKPWRTKREVTSPEPPSGITGWNFHFRTWCYKFLRNNKLRFWDLCFRCQRFYSTFYTVQFWWRQWYCTMPEYVSGIIYKANKNASYGDYVYPSLHLSVLL